MYVPIKKKISVSEIKERHCFNVRTVHQKCYSQTTFCNDNIIHFNDDFIFLIPNQRSLLYWAYIHISSLNHSRCRTSASAMTAVGWWSVLFVAPRMFFPSTHMVERHAHARICLPVWSIAWAASRRVPDWRKSSKSWAANRAADVAPFLAFQVAHPDHLYMVSKH